MGREKVERQILESLVQPTRLECSGSSQLKGGVSNLSAVRRGNRQCFLWKDWPVLRHGGKFETRSEERAWAETQMESYTCQSRVNRVP